MKNYMKRAYKDDLVVGAAIDGVDSANKNISIMGQNMSKKCPKHA